jgi:predicted acetyltransferase
MNLVLRELNEADEAAFLKGATEWQEADLAWYTFEWKPGGSYAVMLERLRKNAADIDVPPQFVPSSMLYAFVNGEIVGRLNVRHTLNEHLKARGGHVGYAVAPKFRGRGYATEIMKQGMAFCRRRGIRDIMVTCADTNVASWKIIEHVGGQLRDKVVDDKGELVRRYWITN